MVLRDDAQHKAQSVEIFDKAFASKIVDRFGSPRLKVRNGNEIFCVRENATAPVSAEQVISDLSTAFELNWNKVRVASLSKCPKDTTFFILHDKQPDESALVNLMLEIAGSAPSNFDEYFPEFSLGYSINIPGPGYRYFVFVKVEEDMPDWISRSILTEEILQATLRASDVPTSNIISLLGENSVSDDYSLWFNHNPSGLCRTDLIFMEMLLGPTTPHLRDMGELRNYLISDFNKLTDSAKIRAQGLEGYVDARC